MSENAPLPYNKIVERILSPNDPLWVDAERIEARVFIEADYVEHEHELAEEYAKYIDTTSFLISLNEGRAAGCVRVISHQEGLGFKTLDDIAGGRLTLNDEGRKMLADIEPANMIEVGTLAVDQSLRGKPEDEGRVSVGLYGGIYAEAKHNDADYVLASFDEEYLQRFEGIFGPSVTRLGSPTDYMGSLTTPAVIHVDTLMEHMKTTLPPVYDEMTKTAESLGWTTHQVV